MNKLIFLLSLFSSTIVSAQQIENIDYFIEGKNIVVTYDFINCNSSDVYDVFVVFVEQNQSKIIPLSISGDIKKVSCGSKRIVWNVFKDRDELSGKYQVWLDFKVANKYPVDIEWVQIPAGTFMMGSPNSEIERESDETQHQVTLSAFKMSKNEITFAQYDIFCEKTGREKRYDSGWGIGSRPVINVSWEDATAFANWMDCRLPTEAEWEYACRAGGKTPFNTGENITTNQANFNNSQTLPVGSFSSNAWGLNDMHGNVWEWCSDWYGDYSSSSQTNPTGPSSGTYRVNRGGAWNLIGKDCRAANRVYDIPYIVSNTLGFRLVAAP